MALPKLGYRLCCSLVGATTTKASLDCLKEEGDCSRTLKYLGISFESQKVSKLAPSCDAGIYEGMGGALAAMVLPAASGYRSGTSPKLGCSWKRKLEHQPMVTPVHRESQYGTSRKKFER